MTCGEKVKQLQLSMSIFLFAGLTSLIAETSKRISDEYVVVQIIHIGDGPAKIGLLRTEDSERINTQTGRVVDGMEILGIKEIGKDQFVEARKENEHLLFALKRPETAPFMSGPLLDSYKKQLIDKNGRLSESGKKAITNNLLQIVSAAQQYILEKKTNEAKYSDLEGDYLRKIEPIAGESYLELKITWRQGEKNSAEVTTIFGERVIFEY